MYIYYENENITELNANEIFVFGSNKAGRHGKGAAKQALKFGAKYGQGHGKQGNTYAIPTKTSNLQTLQLNEIHASIEEFLHYAVNTPDTTYIVTKIGCGLAGYKDSNIAPLFRNSPPNCRFHIDWREHLE